MLYSHCTVGEIIQEGSAQNLQIFMTMTSMVGYKTELALNELISLFDRSKKALPIIQSNSKNNLEKNSFFFLHSK